MQNIYNNNNRPNTMSRVYSQRQPRISDYTDDGEFGDNLSNIGPPSVISFNTDINNNRNSIPNKDEFTIYGSHVRSRSERKDNSLRWKQENVKNVSINNTEYRNLPCKERNVKMQNTTPNFQSNGPQSPIKETFVPNKTKPIYSAPKSTGNVNDIPDNVLDLLIRESEKELLQNQHLLQTPNYPITNGRLIQEKPIQQTIKETAQSSNPMFQENPSFEQSQMQYKSTNFEQNPIQNKSPNLEQNPVQNNKTKGEYSINPKDKKKIKQLQETEQQLRKYIQELLNERKHLLDTINNAEFEEIIEEEEVQNAKTQHCDEHNHGVGKQNIHQQLYESIPKDYINKNDISLNDIPKKDLEHLKATIIAQEREKFELDKKTLLNTLNHQQEQFKLEKEAEIEQLKRDQLKYEQEQLRYEKEIQIQQLQKQQKQQKVIRHFEKSSDIQPKILSRSLTINSTPKLLHKEVQKDNNKDDDSKIKNVRNIAINAVPEKQVRQFSVNVDKINDNIKPKLNKSIEAKPNVSTKAVQPDESYNFETGTMTEQIFYRSQGVNTIGGDLNNATQNQLNDNDEVQSHYSRKITKSAASTIHMTSIDTDKIEPRSYQTTESSRTIETETPIPRRKKLNSTSNRIEESEEKHIQEKHEITTSHLDSRHNPKYNEPTTIESWETKEKVRDGRLLERVESKRDRVILTDPNEVKRHLEEREHQTHNSTSSNDDDNKNISFINRKSTESAFVPVQISREENSPKIHIDLKNNQNNTENTNLNKSYNTSNEETSHKIHIDLKSNNRNYSDTTNLSKSRDNNSNIPIQITSNNNVKQKDNMENKPIEVKRSSSKSSSNGRKTPPLISTRSISNEPKSPPISPKPNSKPVIITSQLPNTNKTITTEYIKEHTDLPSGHLIHEHRKESLEYHKSGKIPIINSKLHQHETDYNRTSESVLMKSNTMGGTIISGGNDNNNNRRSSEQIITTTKHNSIDIGKITSPISFQSFHTKPISKLKCGISEEHDDVDDNNFGISEHITKFDDNNRRSSEQVITTTKHHSSSIGKITHPTSFQSKLKCGLSEEHDDVDDNNFGISEHHITKSDDNNRRSSEQVITTTKHHSSSIGKITHPTSFQSKLKCGLSEENDDMDDNNFGISEHNITTKNNNSRITKIASPLSFTTSSKLKCELNDDHIDNKAGMTEYTISSTKNVSKLSSPTSFTSISAKPRSIRLKSALSEENDDDNNKIDMMDKMHAFQSLQQQNSFQYKKQSFEVDGRKSEMTDEAHRRSKKSKILIPEDIFSECSSLLAWVETLPVANKETFIDIPEDLKEESLEVSNWWTDLCMKITGQDLNDTISYLISSFSQSLVKFLIKASDGKGNCCLHYIVGHGKWDLFDVLHSYGFIYPDIYNSEGFTVLMIAATLNRLPNNSLSFDKCLRELASRAKIDLTSYELKQTSLHLAALHNNDYTIKILHDYGANINACDENEDTPLMIACKNQAYKAVETLFQFPGLHTQLRNKQSQTAMDIIESSHGSERQIILDIFQKRKGIKPLETKNYTTVIGSGYKIRSSTGRKIELNK